MWQLFVLSAIRNTWKHYVHWIQKSFLFKYVVNTVTTMDWSLVVCSSVSVDMSFVKQRSAFAVRVMQPNDKFKIRALWRFRHQDAAKRRRAHAQRDRPTPTYQKTWIFIATTVRAVNVAVAPLRWTVNGIRLIKLFLATPFHWTVFIFVLFFKEWCSIRVPCRSDSCVCPLVMPAEPYLLTPWCRVLPGQPTGLQLVKKFPAFHGTRRFITALTSVRHNKYT